MRPTSSRAPWERLSAISKERRRRSVKPYTSWLSENYYIIHVKHAQPCGDTRLEAVDLLREHGGPIAQIIRGEKK